MWRGARCILNKKERDSCGGNSVPITQSASGAKVDSNCVRPSRNTLSAPWRSYPGVEHASQSKIGPEIVIIAFVKQKARDRICAQLLIEPWRSDAKSEEWFTA